MKNEYGEYFAISPGSGYLYGNGETLAEAEKNAEKLWRTVFFDNGKLSVPKFRTGYDKYFVLNREEYKWIPRVFWKPNPNFSFAYNQEIAHAATQSIWVNIIRAETNK